MTSKVYEKDHFLTDSSTETNKKTIEIPQLKSYREILEVMANTSPEKQDEFNQILDNNWLEKPTRELTIFMNFVNPGNGILMTFIVAVFASESGLYYVDYTTSYFVKGNSNNTLNLSILFLNIGLLIILLYNLSEVRKDKLLITKS